jgi:hypothetical protein
MPRVTIAQLQEKLEDLEDRIFELECENEELREQLASTPDISYVVSVDPPRPISRPINFGQLQLEATAPLSWYDESSPIFEERWNSSGYL